MKPESFESKREVAFFRSAYTIINLGSLSFRCSSYYISAAVKLLNDCEGVAYENS